MAPTLQGRHKDVDCPECGYRYRVGASEEEEAKTHTVLTGECPMCRYTMVLSDELPPSFPYLGGVEAVEDSPSYSGDRILVNKYIYSFTDPKRWDIVVFKFPGNGQMNYIKRLVGLPGETLRIYQGDLFVGDENADDADYKITRKPPDKVLSMRQPVHDTDFESTELYEAGWPLRWQPDATGGWEAEHEVAGKHVQQRFVGKASGGETSWLRYRHTIPNFDNWHQVEAQSTGAVPALQGEARPHLVSDFNPYNARVKLQDFRDYGWRMIPPMREGIHWVGDLMVEADVEINQPQGLFLLDLVEGGRHFTARFDLATGRVTLGVEGLSGFAPQADTKLKARGSYEVALANVDDQLHLWVNGRLVRFSEPTTYDADQLYGGRENNLPRTSAEDPGDLSPVGIGVQNADLLVRRLRVWRDIYYIASKSGLVTDMPTSPNSAILQTDPTFYLVDPSTWDVFADRRSVKFPLGEDQYFVMGDNSPESLDARLWQGSSSDKGIPGGAYLERRLLIGKALCVYWPHAWYYIPRTPIPIWPNFSDMRLVR